MRNKKLIYAFGFLFFILSCNSSLAISEIEIDPNYKGDGAEFLNSLPKSQSENEFSKLESGSFKRTYPFNFPPFLKSEIKFKKNKEVFVPGEEISLNGYVKYWNSEAKNEMDKIRENCLKTWEDKKDFPPESICPDFDLYRIPKIEHLGLFVQIWKIDESEKRQENGDFLIDEFYVDKVFSLIENEKNNLSFNWKIPDEIEKGNYYFSFFVNSNKNFPVINLVQNIFSPLNQEPFRIEGNKNSSLFLDKDNINLNGEHYFPIRRTPTISPLDGKFIIKNNIKNTTDRLENVSIKYKLFNWTQEDERNLLLEKNETVDAPGNSTIPIEFSYQDFPEESVNTLKIEISTNSKKSIINLTFVIDNKSKARMTFLGQIEDDNGIYPYACVQYYGWKRDFTGNIKVEAFSQDKKMLASWNQNGSISIEDAFCFALKGSGFENIQKNQCFYLNGQITDGDKKVFEEEISLNCEQDKDKNILKENDFGTEDELKKGSILKERYTLISIISLIIFLFVILITYKIFNKKQ